MFTPALMLRTYTVLMTTRHFAIFDDAARRLKVIMMKELCIDTVIELSARTKFSRGKREIVLSDDTTPVLKRIPLDTGEHIYLWRSPWCIYDEETGIWIPILDSNKRTTLPGRFIEEAQYGGSYSPWQLVYTALRRKMLVKIQNLERKHVAPPQPSAPPLRIAPPPQPALKPPTFVAEVIKRDAIATKSCCAISLDEITQEMKTLVTPCFHLFTAESLGEWLALNGTCPTCKSRIQEDACVLL